jgi:hypothetical protein
MTKLWERDSRTFRLEMNDDRAVIVRIPTSAVGPTALVVAAEAATTEFAREILQLPVPRVLAWSPREDDIVGCGYIVMDEAVGQPLGWKWEEMELEEKDDLVEQLAVIEKRLISVSFSR